MFAVDEATATTIRNALQQGGELSAVAELRRCFPLITDNAEARRCVRIIAEWNLCLRRSQSGGADRDTARADQATIGE